MADAASPKPPRAKLPVIAPDAAAKPAAKKAKAQAGGWAAFTDDGTAPKLIIAARIVLVCALAATIPTILGVSHGARLLWTIGIAALPLFWIVVGYHVWRRICPLAVTAQLGRLVGRPGTRKMGAWMQAHYIRVQFGLMFVGLTLRLVATNGSPTWLAGFLAVVVVIAMASSFVYAGKTWCNFLCPVGLVEKLYTEPSPPALGGQLNAQCAPCVACKKHCPDIDQEQGYWKEAQEADRRLAYFAWPGLVIGFYLYFYLVAGDWTYYFSGAWAYETGQPALATGPGFTFWPAVPRWLAAPLTLVACGVASAAVFAAIEWGWARRTVPRTTVDDDAAATQKQVSLRALLRHRMLALTGFVGFNAFYFFAGQPSLRALPSPVVKLVGAMVVFASAAVFFRRYFRKEETFVQERFAQKLLKKWEWGDQPPSDDLRDIYVVHTERTKQRDARLRAYKETVRELVADGLVSRGELVILDSLRAQLGVTDKEHQKVLAELSEDERQLFDPAYQGSVEARLQAEQHKRALTRVVVDAARAGQAPLPSALERLREEYRIDAATADSALAEVLSDQGPIAALIGRERDEFERLAGFVDAVAPPPSDASSASLGLAHQLGLRRMRETVDRLAGLWFVRTGDPRLTEIRGALARGANPAPDEALVPHLQEVLTRLQAVATAPSHALTSTAVLAVVADSSAHVRAVAAILLSRFDDPPARAGLAAMLDDDASVVREAAVRGLGARARLTRELMAKALADGDAAVRSAAVRAVSGHHSGEMPALGPTALAQTQGGRGNAGAYATLDANAAMASLTTIERMMWIRQVPLFAQLDADDLESVANRVEEVRYGAGDDLCREGDAGDAVFLLTRGRVQVFTGPETAPRLLNQLGPGACIGEMAVFDQAPRSATVRALEPSRVLRVPGDRFLALLVERPEMNLAIMGDLVRRMRGMMSGPVAPPPSAGSPPA